MCYYQIEYQPNQHQTVLDIPKAFERDKSKNKAIG